MIRQFRKIPSWLVAVVFGIVILTFVLFMGSGPTRGGGGSSGVNTNIVRGEIYGQKVTLDEYAEMERGFDLEFLLRYGEWPNKNPNVSQDEILERTYVRMLEVQKARELGVHATDQQVYQAAATFLRSQALLRALNISGSSVPFDAFVKQVLAPEGLTAADFENFIRDELAVQQVEQLYGLSGELITPQEAANEYVRLNQEYSTEIVFFSSSNFLSQTMVTPQEVGQFYTNYMAEYRLPDRVQVSYVLFSVTNYLAAAEQKLMKTNLQQQVDGIFTRYGMQVAPDAKTPDEAKADIRKILIRNEALGDAGRDANDFAQAVFNVSSSANKPASAADLVTIARQKGLEVQTPAPFSSDFGPDEFQAPAAFVKTAFQLTPDSPISEPIGSSDGVYLIALDANIPSEIPPLDQIRGRVTQDIKLQEARYIAVRAGTNFVRALSVQMAAGKSFAAASVAGGTQPQVLPPFSLSTQDLPELGESVKINQLKQAALTTPVGFHSGFEPTEDGGFVLYVESRPPIDQSKMTADLPQFTEELRQQRAQTTFGEWIQREAGEQLRTTPMAKFMGRTK
jgi:parvulin-like peptidyl-prolyl isomerase